MIKVGTLTLDTSRGEAYRHGELVAHLTRAELLIFVTLWKAGRPLSPGALSQRTSITHASIRAHVRNIREKLGHDIILTRRGWYGYELIKENA